MTEAASRARGENLITTEQLTDRILPLVTEQGAELYDLESQAGIVRVLVDKPGGIDTDTLSRVTRSVSNLLDEIDAMADRYVLEVSSPGIERPLRVQRHFERASGKRIKIKTVAGTEGPRRYEGVLLEADDNGCRVEGEDGVCSFAYDDIERANVVFDWGTKKPGGSKRRVAKI